MKRKGKDIFVIISILGLGFMVGAIYVSYSGFKKILDRGILRIGSSKRMPTIADSILRNRRILPMEIPLKVIVDSATGKNQEENKSLLAEIAKYFTIDVHMPSLPVVK